ncbi:NAD(P)-dependent oxidoreductase [Mycoavidus sp. SF9855]|uniref:NAD(P)-dependent oxidoreductase n=1 Tax=Mycoavidus sp. SF9855 TaxID=2968475 RepID=UPI00211B7EE7|nr:NAD(P)-binding domain-containing protein [Mycoavidus sp. SF9855]UUM22060.1 NAD(P)-binding domain-containing protein [Mycoavidus sp. SF9855]
MSSVAVLGLGTMGQALACALLRAGHNVTVWNRTAGKDRALVAKGAIRATSIHDAIRENPIIIVCVLDYSAVHAVLEPVEHELSRRAIFNLTTSTPDEARSMSAWAEARDINYIDAGIMAMPPQVGTNMAFILYSGAAEDAFKENRPLLEAMGKAHYVGADPGLASLLDLAMNGTALGMLGGAVHAITMVSTKGVKAADFTRSLLVPYLNLIAEFIPHLAKQIDSGDYTKDVASKLSQMSIGFATIRKASRDANVSTELLDPLQTLIDRRIASGFPNDELSGIHEELKLSD